MSAYPSSANGGAPLPKVKNFEVKKVLGKGSYGKVYKVQRTSDDQYYALKETDLGTLNHLERMDAVNEVRLLVSISNANVIRYHEAFLNGSKLCVVMEYAPFGDLRYYISKGARLKSPFPEEAVWRIFLQLTRGLAALHANNIIHRDIKPANIFLCANDLLKIGDLGIAKALTQANFARTQIGTPCYMAPEVWAGKPYSYSSDLWSLGCVLYEMMTFKTPMEGRSMPELKMRVCSGRFMPVPPGRYSPELTAFCHNLLSLDPKKRPTPEQILGSSAAQKWFKVLPTPPPARRYSEAGNNGVMPKPGSANSLIDTIVVPRDYRQLPRVLPPPSYDSDRAPAPVVAAAPLPARPPSAASNGSRPPSSSRGASRPGSADKPGIGGVLGAPALPPILHREVSAGVLMPPAIRPGVRRQSYS